MFALLADRKGHGYRGVDRTCELYANAKIGVFGMMDADAEAAWNNYIELFDKEPIPCNDKTLHAMMRVIDLCEKNRDDLEIILYTSDMDERCCRDAEFLGFDVAGTHYSSILSGYRDLPLHFAEHLNSSGLLDSFEQATTLSEHANSLTAADIEPEFPYAPVKVYMLKL